MKKVVAIMLSLILVLGLFAGCENSEGKKEDPTINIAVHANMGAVLAAVADEQGFFEEENVKVNITIVESGVAEMSAMRSDNRTLDLGYIGAGVSWNVWDPVGNQLDLIYLENLGDSEMLIANKSFNIDIESSNLEVAEAIKNNDIYLEVGTTPGTWLLTYIELLNEEYTEEADKIWLSCNDPAYLKNYEAPNNNAENELRVINMANSGITAAMAIEGKDKAELAVVFSPISTAILNTNDNVVSVATTGTKFEAEKLSPGVWVGSTEFISENEDLVQRFVNALVKASEYTSKNKAAGARAAEKLCQKPTNSIDENSCIIPSQAELLEWYADYDSVGYKYMQSMYNGRVGNVPAENGEPKTLGEAFNLKFMMKALRTVK